VLLFGILFCVKTGRHRSQAFLDLNFFCMFLERSVILMSKDIINNNSRIVLIKILMRSLET
jgi:NADH:ubiquinone oxidoreductase subunit H